ncbi:hypothetical protein D1872_279470 [compost metagenome]
MVRQPERILPPALIQFAERPDGAAKANQRKSRVFRKPLMLGQQPLDFLLQPGRIGLPPRVRASVFQLRVHRSDGQRHAVLQLAIAKQSNFGASAADIDNESVLRLHPGGHADKSEVRLLFPG